MFSHNFLLLLQFLFLLQISVLLTERQGLCRWLRQEAEGKPIKTRPTRARDRLQAAPVLHSPSGGHWPCPPVGQSDRLWNWPVKTNPTRAGERLQAVPVLHRPIRGHSGPVPLWASLTGYGTGQSELTRKNWKEPEKGSCSVAGATLALSSGGPV